MSARAAKVDKSPPPKKEAQQKPKWQVVVNDAKPEHQAEAAAPIPLERLREAADLYARPLPHQTHLKSLFSEDLSSIKAVEGDEVEAALDAEGAEAAALDGVVYLKPGASPEIVAHEVAHVLQSRAFVPVDPSGTAAESEALKAESQVSAGNPVAPATVGLGGDVVALRRTGDLEETEVTAPPEQDAAEAFNQAAPGSQEQTEGGTDQSAPSEETQSDGAEIAAPDLGEDVDENPVPTFEPPAMPEIEVDEGAADAAAAEAEAALGGAEDADGLMGALKDAPPSVKAAKHDTLEGETGRLAAEEQESFDAEMPSFDAEMSGEDDLEAPAPVAPPGGEAGALEEGTPEPAPEPEVDPTPEPEQADLNQNFSELLSSLFGFGDADGLGQAFDRVNTSDGDVETSAGQRPDVPLEGETDPERVTDQDTAAREEASNSRQEATQGVLDGPGPEQAQLQELHEEHTLEAREAPEVEESGEAVEGAAAFTEKELDTDVKALFDQHHGDAMASSLEGAQSEMEGAVETRDTERDAEVASAEEERDRLNEEANQEQRDEVSTRRQEIQDARQTAVDDQAGHVADLEAEADTERRAAETEIDDEVRTTEEEVTTSFNEAETEAQDEVDAGDREAEQERARREREAENQSWWDRAADWVEDQFDALTSFINDVFDAVRSAVSAIIDAVKDAAVALIEAAANVIKSAIEAFGALLQAGINALLAEHFPAVAAALNAAVDAAVDLAQAAVDVVAGALIAGITALLDALAAGLDAILAAYQAAVNAALAIARAALTGDWDALARLVLEPILMALGIQPAAFYEMLVRAEEAMDIIIDDPMGFLGNLVDSVTGGIGKFADNFLTHLQAGIISWLTGALGGGITLPERWDLWGVLDLARQILGLTTDMIRRVAVRILGAEAVERIEFFMGYAVELITGGWSALWERIQADLGQLKDMVLDQIKTFLVERIVMAAISWLASMFSPVGALIKLVMTIWNFVMFLKDQLARIFQVVQTIVNTMWEIATGVLEPAMLGVESVLARLLPVAIDLLARLLGLGNVAGRVQRIIGDVQQAIEDAIVRLVQRVIARFTGGRGGGTGDGDDPNDLMEPIAVRGGGETHSLYLQEEGGGAVPMMRSTPMTVESWLNGLARGPILERIGSQKDPAWSDDQVAEKRREIRPLLDRAFGEESQLDAAGDAAERAEEAVPEGSPPPPPPRQLAVEGEQLAEIMGDILTALGLDADTDLESKFAQDIARLDDPLRQQLIRSVFPRLDARLYSTLTWPEARDMIAREQGLTNAWLSPAISRGILRTLYDEDYRRGVMGIAGAASTAAQRSINNEPSGDAMNHFLDNYLTSDLNQPEHKAQIITTLLENRGGGGVASAMTPAIQNAVERAYGNPLGYDAAFKVVTASYYSSSLYPDPSTVINQPVFGMFYADEARNSEVGAGSNDTSGGVNQPFAFFVRDEAGGGTPRFTGNRGRLGGAVRNAQRGNHEWIPASRAADIMSATAQHIETTGELDSASGLAKLIQFQNEVRTNTSDLIFKPHSEFGGAGETVPFFSRAHADSNIPLSELTDAQMQAFYPTGTPQPEDDIRTLQAHAGGLDAGSASGGTRVRARELQQTSPAWHSALETSINQPISDNLASTQDLSTISNVILSHYRSTIWQGAQRLPAVNRVHFDLYYTSADSQWRTYGQLKDHAARIYGEVLSDLETDMSGFTS